VSERTESQTKVLAAKSAAVGLLRELFKLKGSEASEEATTLENVIEVPVGFFDYSDAPAVASV